MRIGLADLETQIADDLRRSITQGIAAGAALEDTGDPDAVFRGSIRRCVRAIARESRAPLLRRFLTAGPYPEPGEIPPALASDFQSDAEVAATIRFIHSSVISRFQGALAELLAIAPLCTIATRVFGPSPPRLFAGDTVRAPVVSGRRLAKAADYHLLRDRPDDEGSPAYVLLGVGEVKSYRVSQENLTTQVDRHLGRARQGLEVLGQYIPGTQIQVGDAVRPAIRIVVLPANWRLPRGFQLERDADRCFLVPAPLVVPQLGDEIVQHGDRDWSVTLRWSAEALAAQAYDMTFTYLAEVGRALYETQRPSGWENLTPWEAGENAAKMMPYYAILRAETRDASSRATALYNSYGFGYALGANFVDEKNRREMLWLSDLEEIAATGRAAREPIVRAGQDGAPKTAGPMRMCRIRP